MHQAFRAGFEKQAYDYKWEVEDMAHDRMKRQYDTPVHAGKASGIGAGVGGVLGGAIGTAAGKNWKAGLLGAGIGAGIGALGGLAHARADKADIDDARLVSSMPDDDRRALLASRARKSERQEDRASAQNATMMGTMYGNMLSR
jgi:hypothetical protein